MARAKRRIGPKGQRKVHMVMGEFKTHTLRSGSGRMVRSRKQAIAIALNEGRRVSRRGHR